LNCTALVVSGGGGGGAVHYEDKCYAPEEHKIQEEGSGYPFDCGVDLVKYEGSCLIKCPYPIVRVGQSDLLVNVTTWFLRITLPPAFLILLVMLLLTIAAWRYWFVWPKIYMFYILVATILYDMAFMMGVVVGGQDKLVCNDEGVLKQGDGTIPVGVAQAWFNYLWGIVLNGCFPALCLSLLLTFTYPTWTRKYYWYINATMHGVLFGVPLTSIIVLQSVDQVGSCDGNFPCDVKSIRIGSLEYGSMLFVRVLPILIYFIFGWLVIVPLLFYRVYLSSGWKGILKQKRLLLFSVCYGLSNPLNTVVILEVFFGVSKVDAGNYYAANFFNRFQEQLYGYATPPPPYPLKLESFYHIDPFFFFWSTAFVPVYLSYVYIGFFFVEAYRAAFKRNKSKTKSVTATNTKSLNRTANSSKISTSKGTSNSSSGAESRGSTVNNSR